MDSRDENRTLYDKDIREPLFDFLEEQYGKVRILEEKNIGRVRADVVMITEEALYGIEIKSDADTYTRLKKQVKNYDMYYDRNIIVVGTSHAAHVSEHVPDWWGIITLLKRQSKNTGRQGGCTNERSDQGNGRAQEYPQV
jgi:hypothetical protein